MAMQITEDRTHRSKIQRRAAPAWSFALVLALLCTSVTAQQDELRLVSYGAPGILGRQGNAPVAMGRFATSFDGRYTVFATASNNLVANDAGRHEDVFLADAVSRELTRISARPDGGEANGHSFEAAISSDGRWVVFDSLATDLVAETSPAHGLYLHDRQSGLTQLISPAVGDDPEADSGSAAISGDGGVVAFTSDQRLVAADTDDARDVYIYLRESGSLQLANRRADGSSLGYALHDSVAVSEDGAVVCFGTFSTDSLPGSTSGVALRDVATGAIDPIGFVSGGATVPIQSRSTALSADGRLIALASGQALLPFDTNEDTDIYVFDRVTRQVELVSVASSGALSDGESGSPSLSADGTLVSFASSATTFHPGADPQGQEIYLHRRATGATTLISRPLDGRLPSGPRMAWGGGSTLSGDGRKVAFASASETLVKADSNRRSDAFIVDVDSREASRISSTHESPRIAGSSSLRLEADVRGFASADGRRVVFNTRADNLTSRRAGGVFASDWANGHIDDAIGFDLPANANAFVIVADGVSDDGRSVLFHREPEPYEGLIGLPPPLPSEPWDLWLSSPTLGSRRIDVSTILPQTRVTGIAMMSGNARRIAFLSTSYWSVVGSPPGGAFLYDTASHATTRVDATSDGIVADTSPGAMLGLSRNGRYLAFTSAARNLVADNTEGRFDLYLRDLDGGSLTRIVHPLTGVALVTPTSTGAIAVSDDGTVLAFRSDKPDLVPSLTHWTGAFRLHRGTGELRHLGAQPAHTFGMDGQLSMSADGRRVAFATWSSSFSGPGARSQVLMFDALTQATTLVSTDAAQTLGDGDSVWPYLTPDGQTLVFTSTSANWQSTPRVAGHLGIFLRSLDGDSMFRSGFE
jgi:Tol biopolymer transport system component